MKTYLRDPFVIVCLAAILVCFVNIVKGLLEENPAKQLQIAQEHYEAGEHAATAMERKKLFNEALQILLQLDEKHSPQFGNGKLYFDIGNSFFQVQEFPLAILYYERAAALRPRDDKVARNLATAQQQLKIVPDKSNSPFEQLFFFHNYLSLPERLQAFTFLAVIALGLGSGFFWTKNLWLYRSALVIGVLCAVLLLSLGYSHYIAPERGILIQASSLYRDSGEQYAKVREEPLSAGLNLKVLDVSYSGKWLQVQTPEGLVGFVPNSSVRVI